MLRLLIALAVAAAAVPAAAFNRPRPQPAAEPLACPEIGTGYVRLPGSATCFRVGGLVRAEAVVIKGGR